MVFLTLSLPRQKTLSFMAGMNGEQVFNNFLHFKRIDNIIEISLGGTEEVLVETPTVVGSMKQEPPLPHLRKRKHLPSGR